MTRRTLFKNISQEKIKTRKTCKKENDAVNSHDYKTLV